MERKLCPESESGVRSEQETLTIKEINFDGGGEGEDEEDDEEAFKHIKEQRSEEPMSLGERKGRVPQSPASEKHDHSRERNIGSSRNSKSAKSNSPTKNRANSSKKEDHCPETNNSNKQMDGFDDRPPCNSNKLPSLVKEAPEAAIPNGYSIKITDKTPFCFQSLRQCLEEKGQRHNLFEDPKNRSDGSSSLLKGATDGSALIDSTSINNVAMINHDSVSSIQGGNKTPLKGIVRVPRSDGPDHTACNSSGESTHTVSSVSIDPIVLCAPHSFGAGYFSIPNVYPAPNVEIKLFVGRVPRNIEEDEIRDLFKLYGQVVNVSVIREKTTGLHRGAALVTMESIAQADFALRELNSIKVLDELRGPLKIQYSTGESERLGFENESCIPGVDQVKLFVGALPKNIKEEEIREIFSPYGQINEIFIMREPHSGIGRGCAFVKYAYKEQGLFAIKSLHGALTLADVNRPIEVRFASKNHQAANTSLMVHNNYVSYGATTLNFNGHYNYGHHSIQKHHSPRLVGANGNVNNVLYNANTLASSMPQQGHGNSKSSIGIGSSTRQLHNHTSGQHCIGCNPKVPSQNSNHHSLSDQLQIGSFSGVGTTGANGVQTGNHHPSCGRAITLFDHNGMAVATTASTAAIFSRTRTVGLPIQTSTSATAAAAITANLMPRCIGMWKEYFTSDGKPYYHNELTQITQWDTPPEFLNLRPNFSREVVGPPGANIFIFNVPYEWDKKCLVGLFCRFGYILSAHLMIDRASGRNKGVAFVSYDNIHSAAEAVNHMNGFVTEQGRKLKVSIKQGQEQFVQHLLKSNQSQGIYGQTGYMENPRDCIAQNNPTANVASHNCNNDNDGANNGENNKNSKTPCSGISS
ncbi:putative RNA binding protein [Cryptosporidium canis]|uniref:RNA binding protein n=1 Tax=Cryptosporidium canis TaxID=195482 RepID=A0A9D5DGQ8_9CRYT|nr:putative RNA binding protein [Cryptosporidium canis]